MKEQRKQVPARRIYQLLWNANSKHPIRGTASLANHWPLPLVDGILDIEISVEDMEDRWKETVKKKADRDKLAEKRKVHGG